MWTYKQTYVYVSLHISAGSTATFSAELYIDTYIYIIAHIDLYFFRRALHIDIYTHIFAHIGRLDRYFFRGVFPS